MKPRRAARIPYHVRLDPDLLQRVREAAEREDISVSAWIRLAIMERLARDEREGGKDEAR